MSPHYVPLDGLEDALLLDMRVSQEFSRGKDSTSSNSGLLQGIHHFIMIMLHGPPLNQLVQFILVMPAARAIGKPVFLDPGRSTDYAAELLHQLDTGMFMKPGKTTVADYLDKWLTDYV